eukprot:TRINITY_DN81758_c0_g1_i1.p1 TRINITY_DN81758_c0_g1~~TRINITY_DN81758_c0_g1_i1.p1  ORF type:complete len:252 (+),score=47.58 TRINITY_DN81758_c0_g1_i1:84-839(+)
MTTEVTVAGGAHCSVSSCNQFDFLPFRCNACDGIYCKDHFSYSAHNCPRADHKSVQVFLCPLCNDAIHLSDRELPDVTWDRHFHSSCRQAPKAQTKPGRCPVPNCREQLGPSNRFTCKRCSLTVCMRHRAEEDHPCQPCQPAAPAGASAASRARSVPTPARPSGGKASAGSGAKSMSEDERLARELQQQEFAMAQGAPGAPLSAGAAPARKKKSMSDRFRSMLPSCFKAPNQARRPLMGNRGEGSSSSSGR